MRRAGFALLVIVALLLASVVAYMELNSLLLSIYGYRTPLKSTPPLTEDLTTPLTAQVILVLVDGLRYDISLQMPHLNRLRQQGAHARLISTPPSATQTAWATLITGNGPETNDMPFFDRNTELLRFIPTDNLFTALGRAGRKAGIAGFIWWEKLIPADSLYVTYYTTQENDVGDRLVVEHALTFAREFQPTFLLVHLRQVEKAGWAYGGTSNEYLQAALRCDEYIHSLAMNVDPLEEDSVLVICSSHGHLDLGGHGGNEAVVLTTPLVVVGQSVTPGDLGTLAQTEVAPIVAMLLGIPIPSAAAGGSRTTPPFSQMLRLDSADKANKLLALARQRLHMGNAYLHSIARGSLSQTAQGDILVAQSSLQVKNYESAAELASLSAQQVDREVAQGRQSRIWAERSQRAPVVAIAALLPLWVMWMKRGRRTACCIVAALLAAALYHVQFVREGHVYSFSRLPSAGLPALLNPSLRWTTIAMAIGGLVVALGLWRERERSIFLVIKSSYGYAFLQLYFVGLVVVACTGWNGLRLTWYVPNLTVTYVHCIALMQTMLIAVLATASPIPVLILQRLLLALTPKGWHTRATRQPTSTRHRPGQTDPAEAPAERGGTAERTPESASEGTPFAPGRRRPNGGVPRVGN